MYCMTFRIVCVDYIILIQLMCCSIADLLSTNTPFGNCRPSINTYPPSIVMNIYYELVFDTLTELF